MKHVVRISKRMPAKAAADGFLTAGPKNFLGAVDIADVVVAIGNAVDNLPVVGDYWVIMPEGLGKSQGPTA